MYQQQMCLSGTTLKELLSSEGCLGPSRLSCSAFVCWYKAGVGPRRASSEAFRMVVGLEIELTGQYASKKKKTKKQKKREREK